MTDYEDKALDQDQDLLDKLDRKEGLGIWSTAVLIMGVALLAGAFSYVLLTIQFHNSSEAAIDGGILVFLASVVVLGVLKVRADSGPTSSYDRNR
jgi:hypothetical protein